MKKIQMAVHPDDDLHYEKLGISRNEIALWEDAMRTDGSRGFTPEELMKMDWLCENVVGKIPTLEEVIPESRATVKLLGVFEEDVP